ncbi:MAG: hypothetical protein FWF50_07615 [Defluviitaleaceae bacterium]|nr:hypothetical protein [Defluviitaleaceae bacterium]
MPNFNQNEFNSIREVAMSQLTSASKLEAYAKDCDCEETKAMFTNAAASSKQSAQKLTNML